MTSKSSAAAKKVPGKKVSAKRGPAKKAPDKKAPDENASAKKALAEKAPDKKARKLIVAKDSKARPAAPAPERARGEASAPRPVTSGGKERAHVIYYVEDEKNIRELTVYALAQAGIEAKGLPDDASFRRACAERVPDAVLLDIMLPDTDGLSILRRIRQTPGLANVPVMMLTARDAELDTVTALDAGADDYLAKPFGMMEMVSRVRALLRRAGRGPGSGDAGASAASDLVEVGPLSLSAARHEAFSDNQQLNLTLREFDLLSFLMRSPGVVFSRETLLQRVWGWDFDGGSRTVDVHVQTLRQKLGERADLIETVRGVGYRLRG